MPKYPLPSDESDQRPGLKPPQIGLSAILWMFALFAVSLYALRATGPLSAAVVVLGALAVGAHILGNALGTQLRDQDQSSARDKNATGDVTVAKSHHFAPTTKLSAHHKQLSRAMLALCAGGAIVGAVVGGFILTKLNADRMTIANLSLAVGSCGVLGGLCGFAFFSFAKVAYEAWRQAHRDI